MRRCRAVSALTVAVFSLTGQAPERDEPVRSPFALKRYVETHEVLDWKALRLTVEPYWHNCAGSACSGELIVLEEDRRMIAVVQHETAGRVYVLYRNDGGWRVTAAHEAGFGRFDVQHRTFRAGNAAILAISESGSWGSDIGGKIESWFDVSRGQFERIFDYVAEGHARHFMPVPFTRQSRCQPSPPGADILLQCEVTFKIVLRSQAVAEAGRRADTLRFTRGANGRYVSSARNPLYDPRDDYPSTAELLRLNYDGFATLAKDASPDVRDWLMQFLSGANNSPDAAKIRGLLVSKPQR